MNNALSIAKRKKKADATATVMHRPMLWPDRYMKSTSTAAKANADVLSQPLLCWTEENRKQVVTRLHVTYRFQAEERTKLDETRYDGKCIRIGTR